MNLDKKLIGNDDEYKKESRRRLVTWLSAFLAIFVIGLGTAAVVIYRNRDTDQHGEFADAVTDNGIDSIEGKDFETEPEIAKESGQELEYVKPLIEITPEEYQKHVDYGREARNANGPLDSYQLCKMLSALAYTYSWADTVNLDALDGLHDYMNRDMRFNSCMSPDDRAMFYETVEVMAATGDFNEAFNGVLFEYYLNPESYNGMQLTFNDFLFTMYKLYTNRVEDMDNANQQNLLYYMQQPGNIEKYPFDSMVYNDFVNYDSMWYAHYAADKGYSADYCFEIEPMTFYEIVEEDEGEYRLNNVEAKYVIPMVLNNEEDGLVTKEIMMAFCDDKYNVVSITPYNVIDEGDNGQIPGLLKYLLVERLIEQ